MVFPSSSCTFPVHYHHCSSSALPLACRAQANGMCHIAQPRCWALRIRTNKRSKKAPNQDTAAGPARMCFKPTTLSGVEGTSRSWLTLTALDKPFSRGSLSHPSRGCCVRAKSELILSRFRALRVIITSNVCKSHTGQRVLGWDFSVPEVRVDEHSPRACW